MALTFYKYHGSGNDFIVINDMQLNAFPSKEPEQPHIASLCDRQLGVGADGLILIRPSEQYDFYMQYYNADGHIGSLCGNGGRCAVAFASAMDAIGNETTFEAFDGMHRARVLNRDKKESIISLQLHNLASPLLSDSRFTGNRPEVEINTGSPHLVIFSDKIDQINVYEEGKRIRHSIPYANQGINVNFVEIQGNENLYVRTFERGVERETLSCGTGVTAAALAAWLFQIRNPANLYHIQTPGGNLQVSFTPPNGKTNLFSDIWLTGPATMVFKGEL